MSGIAGWVVGVVESLGYVGLALLVAFENLCPPLPSELILPLAGFLTGQGRLSFPGAVLAATAGSLLGALILYGVGRRVGEERLRRWVRRRGKWLLIREEDFDRSRAWFERRGVAAVFFGRLVPGVRSFISLPAGVKRMPLGTFCLYTTAGSGLWNALLIGAGWLLGHEWEAVQRYARLFEYATAVVLAALLALFVVRRVRERRAA